jgi:hypothetical protein
MTLTYRKPEKSKTTKTPFEQQKFNHREQIIKSRCLVREILSDTNRRTSSGRGI